VLLNGIHTLQKLDVSRTEITDEGLEVIATRAAGISKLNLSDCICITDFGLRLMLSKTSDLQTLELRGCRISKAAFSGLIELGPECKLSSLNLSACRKFSDFQFSLPSLRVLNMSSCPHLHRLELICSNLTHLNISSIKMLRNVRLDCPKLIELNLSGCGSLVELVGELPDLLDLNMYNCRSIPEDILVEFLQRTTKLTKLSLKAMIQITDATVSGVIERSRQLVEFDVSGCRRLTKQMSDYVYSHYR
jgi:hypothetical protein